MRNAPPLVPPPSVLARVHGFFDTSTELSPPAAIRFVWGRNGRHTHSLLVQRKSVGKPDYLAACDIVFATMCIDFGPPAVVRLLPEGMVSSSLYVMSEPLIKAAIKQIEEARNAPPPTNPTEGLFS